MLQTGICSDCVLKDHREHQTQLADKVVGIGSAKEPLEKVDWHSSNLKEYSSQLDGIKKVGGVVVESGSPYYHCYSGRGQPAREDPGKDGVPSGKRFCEDA